MYIKRLIASTQWKQLLAVLLCNADCSFVAGVSCGSVMTDATTFLHSVTLLSFAIHSFNIQGHLSPAVPSMGWTDDASSTQQGRSQSSGS